MQDDMTFMPKKVGSKEEEYYKSTCPKCGEKKVQRIVYGTINDPFALSPRDFIGGFCIEQDCPKWHCDGCEHEWGKMK